MQINWKVKAFIYKILFIFRAQNILFFIQKKITKRANVKINEINDFWKYHLHNLEIFNSVNILEFGAGKTLEQNYQLLANLNNFDSLGCPILSGTSRKSMIGNLLNRDVEDRLAGSITTAILAVQAGASIIRVHDVAETVDALKILQITR